MNLLKEHFHVGTLSEMASELKPFPTNDEATFNHQFRCRKRNTQKSRKRLTKIGDDKQDRFYPKEGQSEYGSYNPIWTIMSVMNVVLEIIIDLYSVFWWLFKIVFQSTADELLSFDMGEFVGLKEGKTYCFNVLWFRYLIIICCPPAGVFMAYGFSGWLQIIICCLASLFYYFPGLAYALIVINRSDVADYIKNINSTECLGSIDGLSVVSSKHDEMEQCSKDVGESCDDNSKTDCCMNPYKSQDGVWLLQNGKEARSLSGEKVVGPNQGLRYCRNDTKKIKFGGICVWKENDKPG